MLRLSRKALRAVASLPIPIRTLHSSQTHLPLSLPKSGSSQYSSSKPGGKPKKTTTKNLLLIMSAVGFGWALSSSKKDDSEVNSLNEYKQKLDTHISQAFEAYGFTESQQEAFLSLIKDFHPFPVKPITNLLDANSWVSGAIDKLFYEISADPEKVNKHAKKPAALAKSFDLSSNIFLHKFDKLAPFTAIVTADQIGFNETIFHPILHGMRKHNLIPSQVFFVRDVRPSYSDDIIRENYKNTMGEEIAKSIPLVIIDYKPVLYNGVIGKVAEMVKGHQSIIYSDSQIDSQYFVRRYSECHQRAYPKTPASEIFNSYTPQQLNLQEQQDLKKLIIKLYHYFTYHTELLTRKTIYKQPILQAEATCSPRLK